MLRHNYTTLSKLAEGNIVARLNQKVHKSMNFYHFTAYLKSNVYTSLIANLLKLVYSGLIPYKNYENCYLQLSCLMFSITKKLKKCLKSLHVMAIGNITSKSQRCFVFSRPNLIDSDVYSNYGQDS